MIIKDIICSIACGVFTFMGLSCLELQSDACVWLAMAVTFFCFTQMYIDDEN